jgi:hypothetical protein
MFDGATRRRLVYTRTDRSQDRPEFFQRRGTVAYHFRIVRAAVRTHGRETLHPPYLVRIILETRCASRTAMICGLELLLRGF